MKDILGHLVGSEWAAEGNVGATEAAGSPAGQGTEPRCSLCLLIQTKTENAPPSSQTVPVNDQALAGKYFKAE